tara:strand:- start:3242 stop:4045 length:804 start_codon:yes stop_codon:yes gene_type:complete
MRIKSTILMFFFVVFSTSISAENIFTKRTIQLEPNILNSSFADSSLFNKYSLRFAFGITSFYGDIMEKGSLSEAYSVHLEAPIKNRKHLLQLGLIKGSTSGKDFSSSYTLLEGPLLNSKNGESFQMEFIELDLNYVLNLSMIFDENIEERRPQWQKIDFLFKMGVGLNMFRSLRREVDTENFINSYGYEWNWQNNFENAGTVENDNVTERVLLFGIISKYNVSERIDIDFSVTSRYGNTDKWDAKVQNNKDMFMFYSLGTNFKISKN